SEIDRIKESRLTGDDGRFGEPDDPYLGPRAVEEKYGFCWLTLNRWSVKCPYLAAGFLTAGTFRAKHGPRSEIVAYREADLREIQRVLTSRFDGYYDSTEGRRLNMAAARRRFGFTMSRLQRYMAKCPYLPTGKLESVKLKPPRKARRKEHTF